MSKGNKSHSSKNKTCLKRGIIYLSATGLIVNFNTGVEIFSSIEEFEIRICFFYKNYRFCAIRIRTYFDKIETNVYLIR